MARIVKTENKLNAKIAKLKKSIAKKSTDTKAAKLKAMAQLQERIRKIRKLASLSQREALNRAGEKASQRLAKEVQKRLNVIKKNIQDRKNLVQSMKNLKQIIDQLPRSIRGDLNTLFPKLSSKLSLEAQYKLLNEAVARVEAKIDGYIRVEQRNRLGKAINRGLKTAATKGAELNIFQRIKDISQMSRDEALDISANIINKEELSPADVVTVFLHDNFGGASRADSGMTSTELRASAVAAEYILGNGKLLIDKRLEERGPTRL
jgi:hemerythrin-like domain-containing protein